MLLLIKNGLSPGVLPALSWQSAIFLCFFESDVAFLQGSGGRGRELFPVLFSCGFFGGLASLGGLNFVERYNFCGEMGRELGREGEFGQ